MPLTASKILNSRPRYQQYLEEARWEDCVDPRVKDFKQKNFPNIMRGLNKIVMAEEHMLPTFFGALYITVFTDDEVIEYGLASLRVVTTSGVNFLTDAFQGLANMSLMRYHGVGTSSTSETTGDTALGTELTTQLTPASTRATGTLTEGASANIFRTVGSNVLNSSVTATEHGIFSQAATGGGTLLDRSVFAGVGLVNGNTFQTTYDLTTAAGG